MLPILVWARSPALFPSPSISSSRVSVLQCLVGMESCYPPCLLLSLYSETSAIPWSMVHSSILPHYLSFISSSTSPGTSWPTHLSHPSQRFSSHSVIIAPSSNISSTLSSVHYMCLRWQCILHQRCVWLGDPHWHH